MRNTPKPNHTVIFYYLNHLKKVFNKYYNFTEAKKEVLANLANFAYDPINYDHIKKLRILDIFLEQLSENCEELLHFALAGICNLSSGSYPKISL